MADPRVLVVYYSRSGTTRKVAQCIAAALQCDSEEIVEGRSRSGILGYLRSVIEARRQTPARVALPVRDPSTYDVIVVGTPVWAWSVSSPVRAYMVANQAKFPQWHSSARSEMPAQTEPSPRCRTSRASARLLAWRSQHPILHREAIGRDWQRSSNRCGSLAWQGYAKQRRGVPPDARRVREMR